MKNISNRIYPIALPTIYLLIYLTIAFDFSSFELSELKNSYENFFHEKETSITYDIKFELLDDLLDAKERSFYDQLFVSLSYSWNNSYSVFVTLLFLIVLASYKFIVLILTVVKHENFSISKTKVSLITLFIFLPFLYIVINFIQQDFNNINFWKQELNNGFLAIRIISASLFFYFIMFLIEIINIISLLGVKLENDKEINDKILRILSGIYTISYYNCVVVVIILSKFTGGLDTYVAITSWALLFIVDDWKIISDYTIVYSKQILNNHNIKLRIFDMILFTSAIFTLTKISYFFIFLSVFMLIIYREKIKIDNMLKESI